MTDAPSWGTADEPARSETSDTVTMIVRLQVRDQTEVIGVGISESDWEYDAIDALEDLVARFIDEAARRGIVPQVAYYVAVQEDEGDGKG